MDAGQLTAYITLLRKTATRDSTGGEVVTFVDHASVSAKAEPLRMREFVAMQQIESGIDIRFTIYYREDVRADWRVCWRGQEYEIVGTPIDVRASKEWLELMCKTAQGM